MSAGMFRGKLKLAVIPPAADLTSTAYEPLAKNADGEPLPSGATGVGRGPESGPFEVSPDLAQVGGSDYPMLSHAVS